MLPKGLQSHIEQQIGCKVVSAQIVSGGSINQAARVEISDIGTCFLKWNTSADPDMFEKEALGLNLLADAETKLIIPKVIAKGKTSQNTGYLLLEFLEEQKTSSEAAHSFGQNLASLHSHTTEMFGLEHDNFIGKLHQSNTQHANWVDFFIEERIEPQLKMAVNSGHFSSKEQESFKNLYNRLSEMFPEEEPGLLHGDLWGGNYFYTGEGKAAIFDPAVYYGNREIELAFTHLFGGFSSGFYEAYDESFPLEPGFNQRKNIYNLYPLLVHTNLFGSSYSSQVKSIISRFK